MTTQATLPDHITIESFELEGAGIKRITLATTTPDGRTTLHEFKPTGPIGDGWRPWARKALERMDERGIKDDDARASLEAVAIHGNEPYYTLKIFVNKLR